MILCNNFDPQRKQFYFEHFPETPLAYLEKAPKSSSEVVSLRITDQKTQEIFLVFLTSSELQKVGISFTSCKRLESSPEKLRMLIKNTEGVDQLLRRATSVASMHLPQQSLLFFTDRRTYANRIINNSICSGIEHVSGIPGVPGMYFAKGASSINVFINLKGTRPIGSGTFGKVRKVLWLTASRKSSVLAAKKVFKNKIPGNKALHFEREILTLREFYNKRGIISLIAGGMFGGKYAMFLPIYEYDLFSFLEKQPGVTKNCTC